MIETLGKLAVQQSSFVKIIFNNPLPILESGNATVFLGQKFCYFPEILAIRSFQSSKEFLLAFLINLTTLFLLHLYERKYCEAPVLLSKALRDIWSEVPKGGMVEQLYKLEMKARSISEVAPLGLKSGTTWVSEKLLLTNIVTL